jgi:LPS export ABC transporter protein LptC
LKSTNCTYRYLSLFSVLLFNAMLTLSCEVKIEKTGSFDILTLPSLSGKDISTVFTDSGNIQLIMSSPVMERWDNMGNPYTEFRHGMIIEFYDGQADPVANVAARYAKYVDSEKLWELDDSVVVVNRSGDRLETEQLFWDQEKERIFTDRFVKITNEDQTIMGTGFESDPNLTKRRIKNVTATIYLHDE